MSSARFPTADDGEGAPFSALSQDEFESLFSPIFAADISSQRVVAPPFLFDPIFRSRTISMLSAEPFTGKTLLMMSMLLSLDSGVRLVNRFEPARGHRCLFLGQDAPTWDYYAQFLKLFRGLGLPPKDESTIPLPSILLLNRGLSISSPEFIPLIENAISLYGITVLFIDTLLEFHQYDENSNREMSRVMRLFKHLRDKHGLTILFSHHVNKSGGPGYTASANYRARGASVIAGTVDHHIFLSVAPSDDDSVKVSVEFAKGRGLSLRDKPFSFFNIEQGTRADGREFVRLTPQSVTPTDRLLSYMSIPQSRERIEAFYQTCEKQLSPAAVRSKVSRILDALRAEGKIEQVTHGFWVAAQPKVAE